MGAIIAAGSSAVQAAATRGHRLASYERTALIDVPKAAEETHSLQVGHRVLATRRCEPSSRVYDGKVPTHTMHSAVHNGDSSAHVRTTVARTRVRGSRLYSGWLATIASSWALRGTGEHVAGYSRGALLRKPSNRLGAACLTSHSMPPTDHKASPDSQKLQPADITERRVAGGGVAGSGTTGGGGGHDGPGVIVDGSDGDSGNSGCAGGVLMGGMGRRDDAGGRWLECGTNGLTTP